MHEAKNAKILEEKHSKLIKFYQILKPIIKLK